MLSIRQNLAIGNPYVLFSQSRILYISCLLLVTWWIGVDTYTNCTSVHDLLLKVWLMGCDTCIHLYWLMGKGIAYGGLPFLGTSCPIPDVANIYLIWNALCMSYCLYNCPLPWDVSTHEPSFWKADWTSYHGPPLYHIYILHSDNQQECFRLLSNWFSLRSLGPWINHLPPVWWSNFRFMFLDDSWCVSLT